MKIPFPERRNSTMKPEDLWMIGIVAFCILFTASFGWGLWG
jgi:hypothetical protein